MASALRREHFAGLIAAQQPLGITAVELDLTDTRAFENDPAAGSTPRLTTASGAGAPPNGHADAPHRTATPAALQARNPRELGQQR